MNKNDRLVARALCFYHEMGWGNPTVGELARTMNMAVSTVRRAMLRLQKIGLVFGDVGKKKKRDCVRYFASFELITGKEIFGL